MSTENEYTPSLDQLRDLWVDHLLDPLPRREGIALVPDVQAAFDRWLAAERVEVAAKALEEVADGSSLVVIAEWLRAHAAVLRASTEEASGDELPAD